MVRSKKSRFDIEIVKNGNTGWRGTTVDSQAYRDFIEANPGCLGTSVFLSNSTSNSGTKLSNLNETIKNEITRARARRTTRI